MKQFRFENLILIAIYICVFPMGFKVSLALNKLFDYMSEIVASIWSMCMVYLLVGVLCAGFAVLLDRIEERVKSVSRKGGNIILFILGLNIIIGFSSVLGVNATFFNGLISFNYFDNPRYMTILSMVMCFSVIKSITGIKKERIKK